LYQLLLLLINPITNSLFHRLQRIIDYIVSFSLLYYPYLFKFKGKIIKDK